MQDLEPIEVECNECGDTIKTDPRNKQHFVEGNGKCDDCYNEEIRNEQRRCLDPDYNSGPSPRDPRRSTDAKRREDGRMSRPKALERLMRDNDGLPIVDYDGGRIEQLQVEYGRGIGGEFDDSRSASSQSHQSETGGEPDEHWVEKIVKITDCEECGYPRARHSYKANAGHHVVHSWDCPDCGHDGWREH